VALGGRWEHPLDELPEGAVARAVTVGAVQERGRRSLRVSLVDAVAQEGVLGVDYGDQPTMVLLPLHFSTGVVEVDLSCRLLPTAPDYARGFAGLAYHVEDGGDHFEAVYLRPTNGTRAGPPPERRGRAVQYFAYPEWPYDRIRAERPDSGYEGPADIGLLEWFRLRLDVRPDGVIASVDGQEVLRAASLAEPRDGGGVGLWVDIGTEAHFAALSVSPNRQP